MPPGNINIVGLRRLTSVPSDELKILRDFYLQAQKEKEIRDQYPEVEKQYQKYQTMVKLLGEGT